jgi:hypothetical protein
MAAPTSTIRARKMVLLMGSPYEMNNVDTTHCPKLRVNEYGV